MVIQARGQGPGLRGAMRDAGTRHRAGEGGTQVPLADGGVSGEESSQTTQPTRTTPAQAITVVEQETDERLKALDDAVPEWVHRCERKELGWPRFRGGDFERVVRRAFRVMRKFEETFRAQAHRQLGTEEQIENAAVLVGEYHVWKHMIRRERLEDHPRTSEQFAERWNTTQQKLRTILWAARYVRWEHRYIVQESSQTRVARTKQALHETVDELMEYPAPQRNANVFKTALEAEGAIVKAPAVTFNDNRKVAVIALSAKEEQQLLRDVARMAKEVGLLGGSDDEIPLAEVVGEAGAEHAGENQALPGHESPGRGSVQHAPR